MVFGMTEKTLDILNDHLVIDPSYVPSDNEEYMSDKQIAYFKKQLTDLKEEILRDSKETLSEMQVETTNHPDIADRASSETDRALELRTRDRQRKLIPKIDSALNRIREGEYGYCEHTGDPIGVRRLMARPTATLSLEAQELHEKKERVHKD